MLSLAYSTMKVDHSKQARSSAHDGTSNSGNNTTPGNEHSAQFHSRRAASKPAAVTASSDSSAVNRTNEMHSKTALAKRRNQDLSNSAVSKLKLAQRRKQEQSNSAVSDEENGATRANDDPTIYVLPGSFAVPGINAQTATHALYREDLSQWRRATSIDTVEPPTNDSNEINGYTSSQTLNNNDADDSLIMLEAELIDPEAQRREQDLLKEQWMKQVQDNTVPAQEVVNETMEKRRRWCLYALALVLTMIIATIIGAVVGRKGRPDNDFDQQEALIAAIKAKFTYDANETDWEKDPNSPQYQAANWMELNDTVVLNDTVLKLETEDDQAIFGQCFAMCVLAFATGVDEWLHGREKWLDPISECEWNDITCDSHGRITGINLGTPQQQKFIFLKETTSPCAHLASCEHLASFFLSLHMRINLQPFAISMEPFPLKCTF